MFLLINYFKPLFATQLFANQVLVSSLVYIFLPNRYVVFPTKTQKHYTYPCEPNFALDFKNAAITLKSSFSIAVYLRTQ